MQMQGCKEIPRQSLMHCFGRNIAEMLLLLKKLFIFIFESWICISSLLAADNNSSVFNVYENFLFWQILTSRSSKQVPQQKQYSSCKSCYTTTKIHQCLCY